MINVKQVEQDKSLFTVMQCKNVNRSIYVNLWPNLKYVIESKHFFLFIVLKLARIEEQNSEKEVKHEK